MSGEGGIALAAIAIVATSVGALIWIIKFLMKEMRLSLDRNAKAHLKVAAATDKNTKVSQETLTFLRALNGKVAKATIQTIKEQKVEHQVIKKQDTL